MPGWSSFSDTSSFSFIPKAIFVSFTDSISQLEPAALSYNDSIAISNAIHTCEAAPAAPIHFQKGDCYKLHTTVCLFTDLCFCPIWQSDERQMPCLVLNHICIQFSFIFYFHSSTLNSSLTVFVKKKYPITCLTVYRIWQHWSFFLIICPGIHKPDNIRGKPNAKKQNKAASLEEGDPCTIHLPNLLLMLDWNSPVKLFLHLQRFWQCHCH